jgi:hypothetical protein
MSRREDTLLDEVRAARPTFEPTAQEWLDGEGGRRVLARLLAAESEAEARRNVRRRRPSWTCGPRLAFAVGAAAVLAVAIALTVVFAGHWASNGGLVATPETPVVVAGQVTKEAAVAGLLPAYRAKVWMTADRSPTTIGLTPTDEAVMLGLLSAKEASAAGFTAPMTNGAFAVLVADAFASILLPDHAPLPPVDPQASPQERKAIEALMSYGIILAEDGTFIAGQTLTKDVESRLVGRLERIIDKMLAE